MLYKLIYASLLGLITTQVITTAEKDKRVAKIYRNITYRQAARASSVCPL